MTDLEKLMCEYGITEEKAVSEAECEGLSQEVKWEDLKWQRKNIDKKEIRSK
jgi:hypothetical protein